MIHNPPRTVFDYLIILAIVITLIVYYFTDTANMLAFAAIAVSLRFLVRPAWLLFNYKRLKTSGTLYDATVVESSLISIFKKGHPHKVVIQLNNSCNESRKITIRQTYMPPREGEAVKVLYCANEPDNFLVMPLCYYVISMDLLMALVLIGGSIILLLNF